MGKFILLVLIIAGIWAYYTHFNFGNVNINDLQKNAVQIENNAKNDALNGVKGEKTISKFNKTGEDANKATQNALNN